MREVPRGGGLAEEFGGPAATAVTGAAAAWVGTNPTSVVRRTERSLRSNGGRLRAGTFATVVAAVLGAWLPAEDAEAQTPARATTATPAQASPSAGCEGTLSREKVARCAVAVSGVVGARREGANAAVARTRAAEAWFPSSPVVAFSIGRRVAADGAARAVNLYGTLAQEIEVAGQRGLRRAVAEADVAARREDVVVATRDVAADAYRAYFEALAAREALAVARTLEAVAVQIAKVAAARAEAGVSSSLDAETAEAASLRVVQGRVVAESEETAARVALASLLAVDPSRPLPDVSGELEPLRGVDALALRPEQKLVLDRPELRTLAHERRARELRGDAFRRARIPNPTLSLFVQNDGFDERVFGAGLAFPLPLPHPFGRMYVGEIAEQEALARQTQREVDLTTRELTGALAIAASRFRGRRAESAIYTAERAGRAERALAEIARELEAGRLPVRDALVAETQLIDVLRGRVETRRALCLASVDLAVAGNVALEGEPR